MEWIKSLRKLLRSITAVLVDNCSDPVKAGAVITVVTLGPLLSNATTRVKKYLV
jgi:hypothetical protein